MLAKVKTATTIGLDCEEIEVEVDLSNGLPCFNIVGLPDKAVEEARERVKSAIKNSGAAFPQKRITVNLAPGDIRKEGPSFDLPIALGILTASEQILGQCSYLSVGELSLDGKIRRVSGVLPISLMSKEKNYKKFIVPKENAREAAIVAGSEIIAAESLKDLIYYFRGEKSISKEKTPIRCFENTDDVGDYDMANIKGQEHAKRALEIAAAGGHNVHMSGPPGSGKTLLAKTLTTILPNLTFEESLEVSKIYSIAGMLPPGEALITRRPFRCPHHTASDIALVGGGKWPKPGEISLSHRGVLFLDEFPEFPRNVIEMMRQPLEDGHITISRANGTLTFPAKFILVSAQNPCPCGYLNDPIKTCSCSPSQIIRYQRKISGPLLDRIDIHIEVPRVDHEKLFGDKPAEPSKKIKERIEKARLIQQTRFSDSKTFVNAEMNLKEMKTHCPLDVESKNILKNAVVQLGLSARSFSRILKVARTIADLAGSEKIENIHVAEALQYRLRSN